MKTLEDLLGPGRAARHTSPRERVTRASAAAAESSLVAPLCGWQGTIQRKPWDYALTAAIPHLETPGPLAVCIDVLRAQTARPYIVIVDTGSSRETRAQLEALRADDVEIHYLAAHAYRHASEPVAVALDVAQALCRTPHLFHTHADCFLRRPDFLADTIASCTHASPVVGYRMSPRDWATTEWRWMVGHTATLLHMPTINAIGATWSMQRMHTQWGYAFTSGCGGWPDTETGFNHCLRAAGITPVFIGDDRNGERQVDANIDHVRSYAGSKIYSEAYHAKASDWMAAAIAEARTLIAGSCIAKTNAARSRRQSSPK